MNGRETILARIREALKAPAPHPASHGAHAPHGAASEHGPDAFRHWLPPVGDSPDDRLALFAKNSEALKTTFVVCESPAAAAAHATRIASAEAWKKVAAHRSPLVESVLGDFPDVLFTDGGFETAALEACDAGFTTCECLVAQTGSALVSSRDNGGRALSVLPPHHIIVATRSQLLPDLSAAFELVESKYGGNFPSMLSFITGPSRTGDIERILVLGAHGPKNLTILLLP